MAPAQQNLIGCFIAGAHETQNERTRFANVFPGSGEIIGHVLEATQNDVDRAVESAQVAFGKWSAMSGTERGRILRRAADILRSQNARLAEVEVLDTGKPIREAGSVDVQTGADCIEYYAGLAASLHGQQFALPGAFAYTRREPIGVCAGIGAWNYPLQIACWKSAPALACGNTMVFKPSELTPTGAVRLAEVYIEAGVPAGVFNVVQGGAAVGQMLSRHMGIRKVSFTGEVETGKKVMADAALSNLKRVTMELGGKSPLIVFGDADLEGAVEAGLLANFYTQGEICTNGTRIFVHASIRERFAELLTSRARQLVVGDPRRQETQVGALISAGHLDKVLGYIDAGRRAGASILCGGGRAEVPSLPGGFFVQPTIFDGCTDGMSIVREEIFGPVAALLSFQDEDEVIARANQTPYGLAAGLFTKDLARAHRVAHRLEAGICWINNYNITPIEIPLGGTKQSGIGQENSLATLEHYTELKTIYVELSKVENSFG